MPAITASDNTQLYPLQPRFLEKKTLLPLMAHFSSANLSCEELARPETPWLPQRMWNWLAIRGEPATPGAQRNETRVVSVSLAEEEARLTHDEENPSSSLPARVVCAALSLLNFGS